MNSTYNQLNRGTRLDGNLNIAYIIYSACQGLNSLNNINIFTVFLCMYSFLRTEIVNRNFSLVLNKMEPDLRLKNFSMLNSTEHDIYHTKRC